MPMIRWFVILLLYAPGLAFAQAQDIRISDGDDHVLDIASDGTLQISTTNEASTDTAGAPDRRISDSDDHVLDINSDGTVTVKFGSPR